MLTHVYARTYWSPSTYEEFRRKTSYTPNQKNPVFACNVLALCYVKIFLRKTSYKAGCGRFAISVLLQNGISDSDVFPQNGLCSPRTGTATAPARAPRLRHRERINPSRCQFERRHSRIDWTVSKFVSHKWLEHLKKKKKKLINYFLINYFLNYFFN